CRVRQAHFRRQAAKPKGAEPCSSFFSVRVAQIQTIRDGTRVDRRRKTIMHKVVCGALGALALTAWAVPVHAQATEPDLELALMPRTMDVTLLNEGGKYVLADLKHIPQGGTCRMDEGATLMRVGPGASPETTRVRYAASRVSPGG